MTEIVTAFEHCNQTLNWCIYLHKNILSLSEASVLLRCDAVFFRCIVPRTSKMLSHQKEKLIFSNTALRASNLALKLFSVGTKASNLIYTRKLQNVLWVCFNPLNPKLNPICYLLALLGAHHFLHVSRIRVKSLTFRRLMSYIYGAPILDVSRSHTTTQHSR